MDLKIKEFPVTRFQGSKRKIVPWIYDVLTDSDIEFNTALDAFGGTATVSYLFKKMGKQVTYNDNLKFNYLIGKALIENSTYRVSDEEIQQILTHKSDNKFIQKTFKGIYFLNKENVWLDNVIDGIEKVFIDNNQETEFKKAIAYYALFQACIIKRPFNLFHRKNLYIRTNDVDRNFGNKTTWEKPFKDLFLKFIQEANTLVFDNSEQCHSLNQSAFEIDPHGYDLVYLDPPYYSQNGNHETANYSKCYHFLEGIANYETWNQLIDYSTPNLRFIVRENGDDFMKGKIYDKFEQLFDIYRNSIILFSYKKGGLPSIEYIVKTMKRFKQNVFTKTIHYKYALNRQNGDAQRNREVLIIGY